MTTEAENEMKVLQGNPIDIDFLGKKITVKKMSISKQQDAIDFVQKMSEDQAAKDNAFRATTAMMVKILSIATEISESEIMENGDLAEIAIAFQAVWKQNRFDFLIKTIAEMPADLLPSQK